MTSGVPSNAVDDSIQANIVAAGYGRTTSAVRAHGVSNGIKRCICKVQCNSSARNAIFRFVLPDAGRVRVHVYNQQGRRVSRLVDGVISAGLHEAVWDAKRAPAGVYVWTIAIDSRREGSGNIIIGK